MPDEPFDGVELPGHRAREVIGEQRPEAVGEDAGVDRPQESEQVKRVFVADPVVRVDAFGDLVDLRDQERSRPGDPHPDLPAVRLVERADRMLIPINEGSFEALGAAGCPFAVRSGPCAPGSRPRQRLVDHQIDIDPSRLSQPPGFSLG